MTTVLRTLNPGHCAVTCNHSGAVATNVQERCPGENLTQNVLLLSWEDLELGCELGSGSFGRVFQIKPLNSALLRADHREDSTSSETSTSLTSSMEDSDSYSFVESYGKSRTSLPPSEKRFALKMLNMDILDQTDDSSEHLLDVAIEGLQFEADLLTELPRHEHVIALFGVNSFHPGHTHGFLVLERLSETLSRRMSIWRSSKRRNEATKSFIKRGSELIYRPHDPEQQCRATHIGLGIAKAMSFLHSHNVLYRDLKPNNIGFSLQGQVKLFDFGLARKIDANSSNDRHRLTIQVGSLRYMSPECAKGEEYGFSTDVHSFSILLWEVITLERAYVKISSVRKLFQVAFQCHQRPSLRLINSSDIRQMLRASWDPNPGMRPAFASIVSLLEATDTKVGSPHTC